MAESLKENIEIGFNYQIIDDSFNITTSLKKKNIIFFLTKILIFQFSPNYGYLSVGRCTIVKKIYFFFRF